MTQRGKKVTKRDNLVKNVTKSDKLAKKVINF